MFIQLSETELIDKIFDSRGGQYNHLLPTKEDIVRCLHKHSARTTEHLVMPIGTEIYRFYDKEAFMKIVAYLASKPENERYLIASRTQLMEYLDAPLFMHRTLHSFNTDFQVWHISYDSNGNYYFFAPSLSYKLYREIIQEVPLKVKAFFKTTLF